MAIMRRRLRIAALLLLAVGCWYIAEALQRRAGGGGGGGGGGLPDDHKAIFGSWVQDRSIVSQVSAAIAAGKIVRIRGGFDAGLAMALRTELTESTYNYVGCNSPLGPPDNDGAVPPTAGCKHPHRNQGVPVDTTAFFQSSSGGREENTLCSRVEALNSGKFFFSGGYRRQVDPDGLPPLAASVARRLGTAKVNAWVSSVLQTGLTISSTTFGVRNFKPGDLSGMHTDNVKGRSGGLSMTAYFTDPGLHWDATAAGGSFVWCAEPQTPVKIVPEYNTILLFKVGTASKHFVEPVLDGARARYVIQGWWGFTTRTEDTEDMGDTGDTALHRASTGSKPDGGSQERGMLTIG